MKTLLLAASLGMLAGCGGGGSPASLDDLTRYCNDRCARDTRCGIAKPDCMTSCQKGVIFASYRHEFFVLADDCVRDLPCGTSEDTCQNVALQRIAPDPSRDPAFQQCLSARAQCKAAGKPTFSDDYCPMVMALTDAARNQVAACYQRPCEEMSGCLKSVFGD